MNELRPWLRLLGAHRGRLLAGAALMLAAVASAIGLLAVAGWFITATAVTGLLLAAGTVARLEIYVPGAAIRFFALARTASRYFERVYNHDTVLRLLSDLRARVFARLTPLDPATLARFRSATLLSRLTADVDALDHLYLRALAPPAVALLAIVGVAGLLGAFAPAAGIASAALLLSAGGAIVVLGWRLGSVAGERVTQRLEALRTAVLDLVQGLAEWKAFGALAEQRGQIDRLDAARMHDETRLARLAAAGEAMSGLLTHCTVILVLVIGIVLHVEDALSGPLLVMMALAVLALGEALTPLPGAFLQLGRTRAAARRLNRLTGIRAGIVDPPAPAPPPATSDIRMTSIHVAHAVEAEPVLADFDLCIRHGTSLAVIGPSGSGKSTLADLVARLIEPQRGQIRLGGTDIRRLELATLHGRLGYLTQRTVLLADSIAANLRIARPEADETALREVLDRVDLATFVDRLPQGLDTAVGENGVRLSGGQARRVALARVMLRDAPVALLDEPLAGLDAAGAARVATTLEAWLAGRTALVLGHDWTMLPATDRRRDLAERRPPAG